MLGMYAAPVPCFNSRLREEATTAARWASELVGGFNSRLREEATGDLGADQQSAVPFQLTPP